jgi:hypothetical protein
MNYGGKWCDRFFGIFLAIATPALPKNDQNLE